MNVEIFTLCDAATVDAGGKLNLLGSFDRINGRQIPVVHANCALALKIRFSLVEAGPKRLRISFITTDGASVMPVIDLPADVRVPEGEPSATLSLILIIPQITLPNFGEYSIDLGVDGRQEASLPLFARQIPPPATPPAD